MRPPKAAGSEDRPPVSLEIEHIDDAAYQRNDVYSPWVEIPEEQTKPTEEK